MSIMADIERVARSHNGVLKSLRFLRSHYQNQIGVGDLAKVAALSRRGFYKAFRKHLGRAPGHELRRIRIEHAKTLLSEADHDVHTIGVMCGYSKVNSFSVAFRQVTGMPPGQYRRQEVRFSTKSSRLNRLSPLSRRDSQPSI